MMIQLLTTSLLKENINLIDLNIITSESEHDNFCLLKNYISGILNYKFDEKSYDLLDINFLINKYRYV